jgi:hypothetical protein
VEFLFVTLQKLGISFKHGLCGGDTATGLAYFLLVLFGNMGNPLGGRRLSGASPVRFVNSPMIKQSKPPYSTVQTTLLMHRTRPMLKSLLAINVPIELEWSPERLNATI